MKARVWAFAVLFVTAAALQPQSVHTVSGVYCIPLGTCEGKTIWIVDGSRIRTSVYPEFLFGGNDQRYRFIPKGEIWIDNTITADEYAYTVAHELREQHLMATRGLTYDSAHDSALETEHVLRKADETVAHRHELMLAKVSPTDCDGLKELPDLPDSIRLSKIYRVALGCGTVWTYGSLTGLQCGGMSFRISA